jgi:hypothetical protein
MRSAALRFALVLIVAGCTATPSLPTPTPRPTATQASPTSPPLPTPSPTSSATATPSPTPVDAEAYTYTHCKRTAQPGWSVARVWDEEALSLIRQVIPAPGVHARNLFHLSAAMWDAWAAYDPAATGYFVTEKQTDPATAAAREAAMSFAAFRILLWRYADIAGLDGATVALGETMRDLCYRNSYTGIDEDNAAALGNRIAAAVIAYGADDGALESDAYVDAAYRPRNRPLRVDRPGTVMRDPNRWQPLKLQQQRSQGGLAIPGKVQQFIGPFWGHVTPFALPISPLGTPMDPGPPPRLGDSETDALLKASALELIRYSSELDPRDGVTEDISPASLGDDTLGTNDGHGYVTNPVTGQPYAPEVVPRADYQRALAEYWADGPSSETPPGHWNLIANAVSDTPGFEHRFAGQGQELDRLEWDVKLYFVLNGALHDAAIAAWGLKGYYDSVRPISMIRYMGGLGQSSDPNGPSYDPAGLPLEPGLVEVITRKSSAPGQRHAKLRAYIGQIAIRAWRGFPDDPESQTSGVGWIRAVEWVPYQRSTFVTPAFAGYVSGHSTFSRAGAEIMADFTGSDFFPGGLFEWQVPKGGLVQEKGPSKPVTLEWARYADAADAAGMSRLYMGIHIAADDFEGRKIGFACGTQAWQLAQHYFDGSVR